MPGVSFVMPRVCDTNAVRRHWDVQNIRWRAIRGRRGPLNTCGEITLALSFYITTISVALLIAVAAFVFHNHWMEQHGENHF